jgi:hypothetical protein
MRDGHFKKTTGIKCNRIGKRNMKLIAIRSRFLFMEQSLLVAKMTRATHFRVL